MSHCTNIRMFSSSVYSFLTDVFHHGLKFSELGLTDHMLYSIARYSAMARDNSVEVYKMSWKVESAYGNDIDLYVQNALGTYNWYALQAKVMSPSGVYEDIITKPGKIPQWDKLLSHEKRFGSKTYYLLYNGRPPQSLPLAVRNDCIGIPPLNELGLGIVETGMIKRIRTLILSPYQPISFTDVFPDHIDSIRKLFCCVEGWSYDTKRFSRSQIKTNGYQRIYSNVDVKQYSPISDNELFIDGAAPIRIIVTNNNL